MRLIIRLVLFWAICAPLFYIFGLPMLIDHLNQKTRADAYKQCIDHLTKEGMIGSVNSPMTAEKGTTYCHCVSDDLTLTKDDILDIAQKKEPAAITAQSKAITERCNNDMQQSVYTPPPSATPAEGWNLSTHP